MLKEEPLHSLTLALADLDIDGWIHSEVRGRFNWGLRVEGTSVKNLAKDLTRLCYPASIEFESVYAHRAGGRQHFECRACAAAWVEHLSLRSGEPDAVHHSPNL
jgi:hypothetical protein